MHALSSSADASAGLSRFVDGGWVLACGLLSSLWCVTAAEQLGATFDEPIYVTRGLERWRTGSTGGLMRLGTMPLPVDVQTLPLYAWECWRGRPIDEVGEFHDVLPWARAANLVFWWLLLWHAWLAARQLGGRWAGRLAVAVLACEPTFVANAALATTDVCVAACLLALVYHFRVNRDGAWGWRIAWPALWFAAAVLAKASGLVFGGLCLLVIEAERLRALGTLSRWRASLKDLTQIVALGMGLVFVYCGTDGLPQASWLRWAQQLPEGPGKAAMVCLAENLRIFSNAGEGIMRQVTHNVRGHGSYLLGVSDPRALWYYFPVALTIKLSLPLLLAPLAWLGLRLGRVRVGRWYGNWAVLAALVLLVFSLTCRVQIGVRFMLPLVALGVVGLSAVLVQGVRQLGTRWSGRALAAMMTVGVAWSAVSLAGVWPHGLCFVNPLWGGTEQGYRQVSEANYDWGQGLKELGDWQRRHADAPLDVWYFGSDPLLSRLPVRHLPLHVLPITSPDDVLQHLRGHRLAVSVTLLHGSIQMPALPHIRNVLESRTPVDRTTTFLIYDFR